MNVKNTKKLFHNFPEIFDREMHNRGFECQDGWFELVYVLAENIRNRAFVRPENKDFRIFQVRQKFGQMRIKAAGADENIRKIVHAAEERSKSICEFDGRPSTGLYVYAPIWFRFLCEKCARLHGCMSFEDYCQEDGEFEKFIEEDVHAGLPV